MAQPPRGIIFSDVDGTFLDGAYRPAMDRAAFAVVLARWRVIWASSRTADELLHLQAELGHTDDAIGENGGVVVTRDTSVAHTLGPAVALRDAWVARRAAPREETAELVRRMFADEGATARTFDDVDAEFLARLSGYSRDDAERALRREASVVLVDAKPDDLGTSRALARLRQTGCEIAHGGRWISIVRGGNKGDAARAWLAQAQATDGGSAPVIAAIGNAANDAPLLAVAEHRFVINPAARTPGSPLASVAGARVLRRPGTAGWIEMVEHLATLNGRAR